VLYLPRVMWGNVGFCVYLSAGQPGLARAALGPIEGRLRGEGRPRASCLWRYTRRDTTQNQNWARETLVLVTAIWASKPFSELRSLKDGRQKKETKETRAQNQNWARATLVLVTATRASKPFFEFKSL